MTHTSRSTTTAVTSTRALLAYTFGFISCIALTVASYSLVATKTFDTSTTMVIIAGLAFMQCAIQLIFFLHIGTDSRPRWKLASFLSMFLILIVIVVGSLWIMNDLNDRMHMTPEQMEQYMLRQTGV